MKSFFISLALIASIGSATPALARNSVQEYDAFRAANHWSHKTLTTSVIDGSIVPEVARIQTQIVDGKKTIVFLHFDRNMTAVERHCQEALRADGQQTAACLQNAVTARAYPTISQGL